MPLDVIMPALGMAQETGRIVDWHKQPGDAVALGDILFEVETDKATMEVEAQGDGFLVDVSAEVGTDVPVGTVIARISDTADNSKTQSTTTTDKEPANVSRDEDEDILPEGHNVIMPTLGMAQDTGLMVAWHKAAGDAVAKDDILFEVETDKSTVEVNAGADGYLAAVLAAKGDTIPVGQTIAIITLGAPNNPVTRKAAPAFLQPAPETITPTQSSPPKVEAGHLRSKQITNGRILASPKMRRLAHQHGLDLGSLVAAGYPQPFHAKDLETLKALHADPTPQATRINTPNGGHLTANVKSEGFSDFAAWAAKDAGLTDTRALMAGFCAASLGEDAIVAVEGFGAPDVYAATADLSATAATDDNPQLLLRDLRFTPINAVQVGPEDTPVLTLTQQGAGLAITLEYASDQLTPAKAISLLSNFAGRMEQPLRHLL